MDLINQYDAIKNWKMIMTSEEIQHCVKKCAGIINEKFSGKKIIIVAILNGAVYFFSDLSRHIILDQTCYFIKADSYGNEKQQSDNVQVKDFLVIDSSLFINRQVILIDELFDNGKTLETIKNVLIKEANVSNDSIFTCTLFKKDKIVDYPQPDLFGISVPDVWLVGYGLDDQGEKRNLTALYGVPKLSNVHQTKDDIIFTDQNAYHKVRANIMKQL